MPQICPSPSRQLAEAAIAFRRARRKFPKNLGVCACSGDAARNSLKVYPAISKVVVPDVSNVLMDPKPEYNPTTDRSFCPNLQRKGNYTSYPSLPSSRTAFWSDDHHGDRRGQINGGLNGATRPELVCAACGKRHSCSLATKGVADSAKISTATSHRLCSRIKAVMSRKSDHSHVESASKSTLSSAGTKKRKHARHKRPCIHAGRIKRTGSRSPSKIEGASQICHLHGYPAVTRRRPSMPGKPQTVKYYNRKASTVEDRRSKEEPEKVYCSDSPTVADFPTKLQDWKDRTQQGCYGRVDNMVSNRRTMLSDQRADLQKTCRKDQTSKSSRNGHAVCKSHSSIAKKSQDLNSNADICLRPSLIKAAQQKVDLGIQGGGKSCKNYGSGGQLSKLADVKSTWDENLNILNHKDSMSILMERFKGNDKHHSLKLQNIYELNSVLGSKTSCGEGEGELLQHFDDTESIETHFLPRKSSSSVNPVTKLGRVAHQALREGENGFKNLRSRLNRPGICCSPKRTPWRRAF